MRLNANFSSPEVGGTERSDHFCQGYIDSKGATVRVRRAGRRAYMTVKGQARGIARPEFEYAIPIEDAEVMLRTLCVRPLVEKTRYTVRHGSHDWMVDVFAGANAGLVLAEIELTQADVFCASGLDGSGSDP